jgi:hypothetical protein
VFANNAPDSFKVFTKPFGGVCVADCGDNEENAKLCAAAPELAETLKWLLDRYQLTLAGKPVKDADEVIDTARNLLERINKKD